MTTDLDLDAIEARRQVACLPYTTEATISAVLTITRIDVPALVAALREARAEVERLRSLADDNWRSWEREATEHARTLGLIGAPKTGEPLSEGEQRRFEAAVERGLRKRAEDQRDDWRRRYEALRDGVTGLCDERDTVDELRFPNSAGAVPTSHLRAVVARVEES